MGTLKSDSGGLASQLCRSKQLRRAVTLAALVASVQTYEGLTAVCEAASNVTLTDGDKANTTSFTGGSNRWSASADATLPAGSAPNASYTYEVLGSTATASLLRTPTSGSPTFGGLSLQIDDGADLLLKTSATVNSLILNGGVVEIDNVSGGGTLAGNITLNSGTTSYLNADANTSLSVTAAISGSGALTIDGYDSLYASNTTTLYNNNTGTTYRADNPPAGTGTSVAGTVTFGASNSYTGVTALSGGILNLNNSNALAGSGNIMFTGGALQFSSNNTNDYSTKIVNSTSSITIDTNGQNVTFAGVIAASNTGGLTKNGAGTLDLPAANLFTGGVTLNAGTVEINTGSGLGALPGSYTQLTFAGNSTLKLGTGIAFLQGRSFTINTGITGTIDTNGTTGNTFPQFISGSGTLAKVGVGDMALQASNTYSGGTIISVGTLRANNGASNGSATGSGNITVAAGTANYGGATLGGNGAVTGTVMLNSGSLKQGGIIAAGASSSTIGALVTGAETWSNGAVYQWKIGSSAGTSGATYTGINGTPGTTYDDLAIGTGTSGQLTVPSTGAAVTIDATGNLTGITGGTTYTWAIAQVGSGNSTITSSGASPISAGTPLSSSIFALDTSGLNASINGGASTTAAGTFSLLFETVGSNNDLVLSYTAAPEPGAAVLASLGAVPLLGARRRRRRSTSAEG
jgi:fibronectin-binding autotransporter adhesin